MEFKNFLEAHRQKIRFAAVGAICYSCGLPIQWALTSIIGLHYLVSYGIAVAFSSLTNWALNRLWTFDSQNSQVTKEIARHQSASIFTTALATIIYIIATSGIGINYLIANIITTAGMFTLNYNLQRRFVFRQTR